MESHRKFVVPTVVRTLGLPRDWQLYSGGSLRRPRVAVAKCSAQLPFIVGDRTDPLLRLRVHSVKHTHRAFVKWVLWRFRKMTEGRYHLPTRGGVPTLRPLHSSLSYLALLCATFVCVLVLWKWLRAFIDYHGVTREQRLRARGRLLGL